MLLDHISLNQLRIFECVFRTKSMTKAATELHLTQSGISQHMKALEETLQVQLFDRIKQKLVPTAAGRQLFDVCVQNLEQLEKELQKVSVQEDQLRGEVVIGVPAEFGINIIVPLISSFMRQHKEVIVRLRIDLADIMNQMLLKGDIDFAFVDDFKLSSRIATEPVYDEILEVCFSKSYFPAGLPTRSDRKFFESLDYVAYKEDFPILQKWFQHHYKMRKLDLKLKAAVSDVLGVARFVTEGVGVGVLPRHNINKLKSAGEDIVVLPAPGKPLVNQISLAVLVGKTHSPAVEVCKNWLVEELKKIKFEG